MSQRKKILLITNAELGQANVYLAVSQELLSIDPSLDLHILSFKSLEKAVASAVPSATFHELKGATWKEALFTRPEHRFEEICGLHPTMWNAKEAALIMPRVACPWTSEELVDLVQQTESAVKEINADLVIADNLFTPAITVCWKLKPNWHVLSPNTYREFIMITQPRYEAVWKHPPPRSTIPYPVPFWLIPSAAYQIIQYVRNAINPYVIAHAEYINSKINTEYSDWGRVSFDPPKGLKIILPSNSAVDFPFSVVPDHLVSCGPIVLPGKPLKEADPALEIWLAKRPTVYINLGTHATYEEADARELAGALKILLEAAKKEGKDLQVLWKLKKRGEYRGEGFAAVLEAVGSEWEEHVRITDWLDADPMSILESGSVICSVNHGGANSYFEAVSAGVPQVVLPVWFDTYDFAQRVEYLGIGKLGSAKHAPKCAAKELGPILKQVVLGASAERFRKKAADLAQTCKAEGGGRAIAARAILKELK
ncbi:2-hydroxyacylsphingosine 1-beta-galactosyltransferase [Colletotrichum truncatum]|uniref:2-hydroxyacylsphingosine 1-beta-galactosyltransferase n=1 Tax=Colletotrichum truncatum TaxID=5467 RepID=A0ACC3Z359_COLTU|nr:2-hydroxyacylsphingosine 1-beta-galactosyltransferase [Colletotrichum truncatum]KAF6793182.1 2-hydroxyacylsphingosine 1-beta-galactosyltransferase [Colletotrichum truncatum]